MAHHNLGKRHDAWSTLRSQRRVRSCHIKSPVHQSGLWAKPHLCRSRVLCGINNMGKTRRNNKIWWRRGLFPNGNVCNAFRGQSLLLPRFHALSFDYPFFPFMHLYCTTKKWRDKTSLRAEMCKMFMQMVMQRGFTWRGSHDNLFWFAKSVTAGRMAKESWLQRLHVKPLIARIQIEFLCNINEFIYCNTLHFFLAKNNSLLF